MFPEAIVKPIGDKWLVVIVDGESKITWTYPLNLDEAEKEASEYNRRTLIVHEGLRKLRESEVIDKTSFVSTLTDNATS